MKTFTGITIDDNYQQAWEIYTDETRAKTFGFVFNEKDAELVERMLLGQYIGWRGDVTPRGADVFSHEFNGMCIGTGPDCLHVIDQDNEVYAINVSQFKPDDGEQ